MATPDVGQIRQFVMHKSASKHRIFALHNSTNELEAVTTLDPNSDATVANLLMIGLNEYLSSSDLDALKPTLDQLPEPVKLSVTAFLQSHTTIEAGDITSFGEPVYLIRREVVRDESELEYQLGAAFDLSVGLRIHNRTNHLSGTEWVLELRTDPGFVSEGGEARTWALPFGVPLSRTWTSEQAGNDPTSAALMVAQQASSDGKQTRLHIVERGLRKGSHTASTLEWVVDVFDTPMAIQADGARHAGH